MLIITSGLLCAAQTYRLQQLRVVGSQRFREDDLVATLGLKLGANVDLDTLKQAADRLMQTGVLSRVEYKYTPLSTGLLVEFTVVDGTDFLPCRYDNIVWIAPEDLTREVHEKVPLYNGEAPTTGDLLDQVSLAISEALVKVGVVSKVRYELHTSGINGPVDAIAFVSDTLRPKVQEITLTGASLLTPQEKVQNTRRLIGDDYSAANLRESLTRSLFFLYGNKGYLRMQVGEPQVKLAGAPSQGLVAVTVPVTEGPQYRWKSIAWSGNSAIPTEDLEKAVPLHTGEIVDHGRLDMELASLQRTYKSKGYLGIKLQPASTFNDSDHTVAYTITISEGPQFHMGDLHLSGLDPALLAKLQKNWKLKRGDAYNDDYLQSFLKENSALINGHGPSKAVKIQQTPTPDKIVDVTLQF